MAREKNVKYPEGTVLTCIAGGLKGTQMEQTWEERALKSQSSSWGEPCKDWEQDKGREMTGIPEKQEAEPEERKVGRAQWSPLVYVPRHQWMPKAAQ